MILLSLLLACEGYDSGASEPLRVHEGVFHPGPLPEDPAAEAPLVTNAGGVGSIVTQGQSSISYAGLTSPDTFSVAVAMPAAGDGYWVVPVGGPDVTQNNELIFQVTVDYGREVPFGLQALSFVAIDGEGRPGPRYDVTVCVLPETANNNLAACDPGTPPQAAVISLSWDVDVDLDLVVVAPDGKIVRGKWPTTADDTTVPIPSTAINDPTTGTLSRDSNADCLIDSVRRESLVFPEAPTEGDYRVYASLYATCGRPHVNYLISLFERADADDGTWTFVRSDLARGELLPVHARGTESLGTYVTTISFP
jgi:hypothetical protein